MRRIYLDNNATTPLDPRVAEAMALDLLPANPSSVHWYGREARNRLTKARRTVAEVLGILPSEVVFTSGGTESLCTVLQGMEGHILSSNLEHPAVYETLQRRGSATFLEPGPYGAPTPEQVERAIQPNTRLIALMAVNNETGAVTDIEGIARVAQSANIPLLVDAVALMGKGPLPLFPGVSAIALSGHKFHGPAGIGLLILRTPFRCPSLLTGGGQEGGRRPGTENLMGIIGLAKAVELLDLSAIAHMSLLRERLEGGILRRFPEAKINGEGPRICNTANIAFGDLEAEALMMNLDLEGVAVSHGSACTSGSLEPSRVLLNMGYSRQRAAASLRFSLSRFNTSEEIDLTLEILSKLMN
ncbi:MAG: cysteine desulfurase family protein [Parachlamydiales bacterium]